MKDLGDWIPEVPLDDFCKHFLPQNDIKVSQALRAMKTHIPNNRWSWFPADPKASNENEINCFVGLANLITTITECSSTHGAQARPFVQNPTRSPKGDINNDTRPDGYFFRDKNTESQTRPVPLWRDICVPHEYKKGSGRGDILDVSK